jgi:hypothetical protein
MRKMRRRKLIVLFTVMILLLNITLVSAAESKNKKNKNNGTEGKGPKEKEEKEPKEKDEKEPKGKQADDEDNGNDPKDDKGKEEKPVKDEDKDKKPKDKDDKNDKEEKNSANQTKPVKYQFPYELHGPGTGKIKNDQEWSGDVWAHYDYNENYGVWEVGIEGFSEDGDPPWYSFDLVYDEVFENNKLEASGTFIDEPFNGLKFTYEANLNSMHWSIKGDVFQFKGTIEDYSFRGDHQEGYYSSVVWRDVTWYSWGESIRVTADDYLEALVFDEGTTFGVGAIYNPPEEFYTASAQWLVASFIDRGDGHPGAGVGLQVSDSYFYMGSVEIPDGE